MPPCSGTPSLVLFAGWAAPVATYLPCREPYRLAEWEMFLMVVL